MKKFALALIAMLLCSEALFSQTDPIRKPSIKRLKELVITETLKGRVDCGCNNNLLTDGGFEEVRTSPGSSNIAASSSPWTVGNGSPQWISDGGDCNRGIVLMWGNKVVYESVKQQINLPSGLYRIKVTVRAVNVNKLEPVVRLKVSSGGSTIFTTPDVSTNWTTFSTSYAGGIGVITLQPENNSSQDNGGRVSWIQVDNICIEKACSIPDEKCSPTFSAEPFSVNSQGNVVVNVNPVITAGAQHYWGLAIAAGASDNTPIPLTTILSGGSFGLGVSSTGIATPVGMGSGINGSTSGYGYHYEGVGLGRCFKITHYIKCCEKWYTQTSTYCANICVETKESRMTEAEAKDVERAMALAAASGRG